MVRADAARWVAQLAIGLSLSLLALLLQEQLAASQPSPVVRASAMASVPSSHPVVHYVLEARLDAQTHHVHGKGRVTWRNTSRKAQTSIFLHLYLNAFANKNTVFMRKRDRGFRGGDFPDTWGGIDIERIYAPALKADLWETARRHTAGDPDDATDIELPLPRAIQPGEELELELSWVSRLPSVTHRTGFSGSFHMVAQWFPKIARLEADGTWAHFPFHRLSEFYADFGTFEVTVDVPRGFTVGASGRRTQRVDDGDRTRLRYELRGAHDFAFTAWDGFAERSELGPGGVLLRCLYPRGLDAVAALELSHAKAGLTALGEAYGPYPYATLTIVHPPRTAADAGGMEYPTLITTGGHWLGPRLGIGAVAAVTVHELAHQWFYGVVATNEYRWPFLDEGLTTFSSTRVLETRRPGKSAFDGFGQRVSLWALSRVSAARAYDRGRVARRADAFENGRDYARLVYGKTATLLETLRRVYGDDGFGAALQAYATEQRFRHPTPADLFEVVRQHVGEEAARNLRVGLLKGGWVDYRVADLDDATEVVAIRQGQLAFDVVVALHGVDGSVRREVWPASERTFRRPALGVEAVVVDPDLQVLIDHDLSNNARRRGRGRVAPRVLTQVSLLTQLLTTVVAP